MKLKSIMTALLVLTFLSPAYADKNKNPAERQICDESTDVVERIECIANILSQVKVFVSMYESKDSDVEVMPEQLSIDEKTKLEARMRKIYAENSKPNDSVGLNQIISITVYRTELQ